MRPAPYPNADQTQSREDSLVADPLSDETDNLLKETARKNREVFTELFRPIPTNLVRSWATYEVIFHLFYFLNLVSDKTRSRTIVLKSKQAIYFPRSFLNALRPV